MNINLCVLSFFLYFVWLGFRWWYLSTFLFLFFIPKQVLCVLVLCCLLLLFYEIYYYNWGRDHENNKWKYLMNIKNLYCLMIFNFLRYFLSENRIESCFELYYYRELTTVTSFDFKTLLSLSIMIKDLSDKSCSYRIIYYHYLEKKKRLHFFRIIFFFEIFSLYLWNMWPIEFCANIHAFNAINMMVLK